MQERISRTQINQTKQSSSQGGNSELQKTIMEQTEGKRTILWSLNVISYVVIKTLNEEKSKLKSYLQKYERALQKVESSKSKSPNSSEGTPKMNSSFSSLFDRENSLGQVI